MLPKLVSKFSPVIQQFCPSSSLDLETCATMPAQTLKITKSTLFSSSELEQNGNGWTLLGTREQNIWQNCSGKLLTSDVSTLFLSLNEQCSLLPMTQGFSWGCLLENLLFLAGVRRQCLSL